MSSPQTVQAPHIELEDGVGVYKISAAAVPRGCFANGGWSNEKRTVNGDDANRIRGCDYLSTLWVCQG